MTRAASRPARIAAEPAPLRCTRGSTAHGPSASAGAPSTWQRDSSACATMFPSGVSATVDRPSIHASLARSASTKSASSGVGKAASWTSRIALTSARVSARVVQTVATAECFQRHGPNASRLPPEWDGQDRQRARLSETGRTPGSDGSRNAWRAPLRTLRPGSAAEAAGLPDTCLAAEQKRSATRVHGLVCAVDGL
jgi:hypothetical protein